MSEGVKQFNDEEGYYNLIHEDGIIRIERVWRDSSGNSLVWALRIVRHGRRKCFYAYIDYNGGEEVENIAEMCINDYTEELPPFMRVEVIDKIKTVEDLRRYLKNVKAFVDDMTKTMFLFVD